MAMLSEKEKYINPLTDFGFKKLFGTEPNKALLIDFLNQVLPDKKIKDLSYSSNEHQGKGEVDRKAIFDLYCTGEHGEHFIVEMQKAKQNYFKDRSVFYTSFPIQVQAKRGNWNYKLDPVYSVGILDFIFDDHKNEEEFLHFVDLKDQHCKVFYDKLLYVYIELPKFTKQLEELETQFDKWLYILRHLSALHTRPKKLQERVFKQLFESAEIAKFTRKERDDYEASLKYYRDIKNVVDTSREEGVSEGRMIGRLEGRKEGRAEGRKESLVSVAQKMKQKGHSINEIQAITGLLRVEIEQL